MKTYFETRKIPTSHIFQNHLDEVHHTIEEYCKHNKKYQWLIADYKNGKSAVALSKVEDYIRKNEPDTLKYFVLSPDADEVLYIEVKDGVTVNIKNGNFALYGLFYSLTSIFNNFKVPPLISFMRRYWVVVTPLLLIISGILLSNVSLGWASFFWALAFVFMGVFGITVLMHIDDEDFSFSSYILDTKIDYYVYDNKLGVPLNALLTSASSIVTFVAGLSTIASTVIYFMNK